MSEENPSIHDANQVIRVLTGKPMKYTVRIFRENGQAVEFQSENVPKLDWDNEARALWIKEGGYGGAPIIRHEHGMIVLTEENPKP